MISENQDIKIFSTEDSAAESIAEVFFIMSEEYYHNKKKLYVALSGGNTPQIFFNKLVEKYKEKIQWKNICFFWADERCVAPTNSDSNYGMTKQFLFDKIQIPAENIYRILGENDPLIEAERYSSVIKNIVPERNNLPSFDLTMLGMGNDGHTASIFPSQLHLIRSEKICETTVHPLTFQKRITLTGTIINNSSQIIFFVTGENKSKILTDILNLSDRSSSFPAAYIKPICGKLSWYLDKDAALLL
ncbi:MAG: 6-phosphogluconolactonase [Ignavibacteriales bacterium]|nr:6-phosphogluconolactonase [Ignavibacteriales bacterium]